MATKPLPVAHLSTEALAGSAARAHAPNTHAADARPGVRSSATTATPMTTNAALRAQAMPLITPIPNATISRPSTSSSTSSALVVLECECKEHGTFAIVDLRSRMVGVEDGAKVRRLIFSLSRTHSSILVLVTMPDGHLLRTAQRSNHDQSEI